jgi:ATP-dependent exoDNAse (exonuclease V) alpha subunit
LAKGDRIRFLSRAKFIDTEVINGTEATIEAIRRREGDCLEIVARTEHAQIRFSPDQFADEKGRAKITHAHATTLYGAQGLTTERAFCWLTPEMHRHDIYVASSRAREETRFFVDAKAIDTRIVAEQPLNQRSKRPAVSVEDRRDYLARQFARPGVKQTTLDVLVAAREREVGRLRREHAHFGLEGGQRRKQSPELSID